MREKSILLKLAELLTGSDNTHQHEIGYLVRKWRDRRLSAWNRGEARKKIDQLEAQLAERAEEKRRFLAELKARAVQKAGNGEELSVADHTHHESGADGCILPDRTHPEAAQEALADNTHSPTQSSSAEPRPQDVLPKHWPYFDDVFMLSGLEGDGVEKLKVSPNLCRTSTN